MGIVYIESKINDLPWNAFIKKHLFHLWILSYNFVVRTNQIDFQRRIDLQQKKSVWVCSSNSQWNQIIKSAGLGVLQWRPKMNIMMLSVCDCLKRPKTSVKNNEMSSCKLESVYWPYLIFGIHIIRSCIVYNLIFNRLRRFFFSFVFFVFVSMM